MSFEKFWQWKGLSPCEIKWRSPINRAAICFFLLLTYCATIYATFSYIDTEASTIEQIGPNLAKKPSWVTQMGAREQPLKTKSRAFANHRHNFSWLHARSPVTGNQQMHKALSSHIPLKKPTVHTPRKQTFVEDLLKEHYLTQQWVWSLKKSTVSRQTDNTISMNTAKENHFGSEEKNLLLTYVPLQLPPVTAYQVSAFRGTRNISHVETEVHNMV